MKHNVPWSSLKNSAIAIAMTPVCISWPMWVFLCGIALLYLLIMAVFWLAHTARGKSLKDCRQSRKLPPSKAAPSDTSVPDSETEEDTIKTLLLCHVNHRISAYLYKTGKEKGEP